MAQQKKMVENITSMDEDFSQWYTDVVKKAELMDYSSVKGCMVIEPYGYAIWENIQHDLDARFKKVGVQNVYMPLLIPESLLQKEKDHIEGFAPECAVVTEGGGEKLSERLFIRPTSETLFCEHYQKVMCCVGKRPPGLSCALRNSCGKKATPCTKPRRKPGTSP